MPCDQNSIPKTAVTTRWGLFEYTRTPQGVRNAPAHFMRVINKILSEKQLHSSNCAFADDLTSHSYTLDESVLALRDVLAALREKCMYISPAKLRWGYQSLELLGHIISHKQLECQPSKVTAI